MESFARRCDHTRRRVTSEGIVPAAKPLRNGRQGAQGLSRSATGGLRVRHPHAQAGRAASAERAYSVFAFNSLTLPLAFSMAAFPLPLARSTSA